MTKHNPIFLGAAFAMGAVWVTGGVQALLVNMQPNNVDELAESLVSKSSYSMAANKDDIVNTLVQKLGTTDLVNCSESSRAKLLTTQIFLSVFNGSKVICEIEGSPEQIKNNVAFAAQYAVPVKSPEVAWIKATNAPEPDICEMPISENKELGHGSCTGLHLTGI